MRKQIFTFLFLLFLSASSHSQPGPPPGFQPPSLPQGENSALSLMEAYHDILPDSAVPHPTRYLPSGTEYFTLVSGIILLAIFCTIDRFVIAWLERKEKEGQSAPGEQKEM